MPSEFNSGGIFYRYLYGMDVRKKLNDSDLAVNIVFQLRDGLLLVFYNELNHITN